MGFEDLSNWIQFGAGTITRNVDSFDVSLINTVSGLRTSTPINLANGPVTFKVKRNGCARVGIILRPTINDGENNWEDGILKYGFVRHVAYGIQVYDGSGYPYLGPDPALPENSEEMKIELLPSGQIAFSLDGIQVHVEGLKSSMSSVYIYLYAETAAQATANFSSTTYVPPEIPPVNQWTLTIDSNPIRGITPIVEAV